MILLLRTTKDPSVPTALSDVDHEVRPVRVPTPPQRGVRRAKSVLWADRRLRVVEELIATEPVAAVVCDDPQTQPFAWLVAERYPQVPVFSSVETAARVLDLIAARGLPISTDGVRDLLDRRRRAWPEVPDYFTEADARPPLVLQLVNNTVEVDSRVQKVARSLAALGYDSVLLGRAPKTQPRGDWSLFGGALVLRVGVPMRRLRAQLAAPPAPAVTRLLGAPDTTESGGRLTRRLNRYRLRMQEQSRRSFQTGKPTNRTHRDQAERVAAGEIPPEQAFPAVRDWADALLPVIVELRPDVIHVHDPTLIPAAVSGRDLLTAAGYTVTIVYDAHEWTLGVDRDHALQVPALAQLESRHLPEAAAVITVSDAIADKMHDHFGLSRRPAVVTNAPLALIDESFRDVRSDIGLETDTPLLVYTGTIAEKRGVDLALEALQQLDGVHLALIARETKATGQVLARARELGVAKRVHRLDYVPADLVPSYLRTADLGLVPFRLHVNSSLGIPTKYREYLQAGLPIVATALGNVGDEVTRTGVGETATPDDPAALAAAVRLVLADPDRYRSAITQELQEEHSWQRQEQVLAAVYDAVAPITRPANPGRTGPASGPEPQAPSATSRPGLLIAGLNSAGQGTAWARALTHAGVPARSLELRTPENPFEYQADTVIPRRSAETLQRRVQLLFRELLPADSLILESGRAVAAPEPGRARLRLHGFREARILADSGRNVGLIFHGSDLRRPDLHARTHPWSPFTQADFADVTAELRERTRVAHEQLATWEGPVMVSTPDLIRQNPGAVWVPVVVDHRHFAVPDRAAPDRVPTVLHLPSKSMMKGSHFIDPALRDLAEAGVIRYRRLVDVPHRRIPELLRESDIFVDQLGMGILGVAALEAMAAGVPVVTDCGPEAATAYGCDLPLLQVTPDSLTDGIRLLASDSTAWHELSAAGPGFVAEYHDGRRSAAAMIEAMGLTPTPVPGPDSGP